MRKLTISFGKVSPAKILAVKQLSWDELCAKLIKTPPEATDKSERGWYCPVEFSPAYRDSDNFVARHALTFDFDQAEPGQYNLILEQFKEYALLMYTTFSHTEEHPRFRLVLPLDRPAEYDEFQAVSRKVGESIGIETMARESHVPSQMMYLPTHIWLNGTFKADSQNGAWIGVDRWLSKYANWTDRSSWPHRQERDGVHKIADVQTPPDEKSGLIGDFCRIYDVPAAIEHFKLPYSPTASPDRWTYTAGSRPEGAILYDDGQKLHSHHDTDPARGQHNAFDLVRLHQYGALDQPEDAEKPITQHPSYKAMMAYIQTDVAVLTEAAKNEFEALPEVAEPETPEPGKSLAKRLRDVLNSPTFPRWLIRNELERGVLAILAGPRGSYKSFKALDWAMRVALTGETAYVISAEGGDFDRRAKAWLMGHAPDTKIEQIPLFVVERRLNLSDKKGIELIREDCKVLNIKPTLFVLDTFSKLTGGLDENDNTAVKQFIGRLDNGFKRAEAYDATVLVVAHTGHSSADRPRGASAFAADTDAEYIVHRRENSDFITISRERFKSSAILPPLAYESEIIDLNYQDSDGEPVTSLILRSVEYKGPIGRRSEPGGSWGKIMLDIIKDLLADNEQVNKREVYAACKKMNSDASQAVLHQTLLRMVGQGFIYMYDDMVSMSRAVMLPENEFEYLD